MEAPNIVTTGKTEDGKSVFVDEQVYKQVRPSIGLLFSHEEDGPIDFADDSDLKNYTAISEAVAGGQLVYPKKGFSTMIAEWNAGGSMRMQMHASATMDIGVMLQGSIECHLDSGEHRVLKQGDILLQRGTMHEWRNPSEDENARMLVFMVPSKSV